MRVRLKLAALATLAPLLVGCGSSDHNHPSDWFTSFSPSGWAWTQRVTNKPDFLIAGTGGTGPVTTNSYSVGQLSRDMSRYRRLRIIYGCARTTPATLYMSTRRTTEAEPAAPCTTPQWGAFEGITTIPVPRPRGGAAITLWMDSHIADLTVIEGLRKPGPRQMVPAGPRRLTPSPANSSALLAAWQSTLSESALLPVGVPPGAETSINSTMPRSSVSTQYVNGPATSAMLAVACSIPYATPTTSVPITLKSDGKVATFTCHTRPNTAITQTFNLGPVTGDGYTLKAVAPAGAVIATLVYETY